MNSVPPHETARGFTLIEIAVVLAIVLTLVSLGLAAINAQLSSASYSITKKRQDAIKDALIGYLGANKRFPCPYVPISGIAVAGTDTDPNANPYTGAPVCASFGVVPFAALGLAREIAEDGWSNLFSYQVFSDPTPVTCPGPAKDWGHSACFGEGKSGSLSIKDGTTVLAPNVVVVVISHGANGLGAWVAAQGTRNAFPPVACEEANNAVGAPAPPGCTLTPNIYYKGERQDNDDVVAFLTANDALQPLTKQGAIKSPTAKVNDDLQTLYDQTLGAKLAGIAMGPSPPAPTGCSTSVAAPPLSMLDPWGNPYVVAEQTSGNFPICVCSGNSAAITSPLTTCSIVPATAICKSIDRNSFNSYLAKAGFSPGC